MSFALQDWKDAHEKAAATVSDMAHDASRINVKLKTLKIVCKHPDVEMTLVPLALATALADLFIYIEE